jgi:tetratricopeptide (TPR) repeat protein
MARVFVSYSTELGRVPQDESFIAAVADAVSLAGHVPVYMAQFTARSKPPAEVCREAVETCQVYIALLGFRYGTPVREAPESSYVELEFELAGAFGLPRLVFLLDPGAVTVQHGIDLDHAELLPRQLGFRRRVQDEAGVTTATFHTPDRLRDLVRRALEGLAPAPEPRSFGEPQATPRPAGLPAPGRCEGRGLLLAALISALTETDFQPLAILGPPGIGKSTLAIAALHDIAVQVRFGARRWFVRCDGAVSGAAVLSAVAAELGVVTEGAAPLRMRVQVALAEAPGLLVLDNLETPWNADQVGTEETLRGLVGIRGTLLVATIRGLGRPAGVDWREPIVVPPLGADEARDVFLAVAGQGFAPDPNLSYLLEQCDGVPLALELLAANAQGEPDLGELTTRWRREKAALLRRGAADRRELSVPVSLELSIRDATMTDSGRRLLSLLGVLPDGVARDELDVLLPGAGLPGAGVLRRAGLAFDAVGRLRTLAPVREYVASSHPPTRSDLDLACEHYCRLAATLGERVGSADGAVAARRLAAEPGNIAEMILTALRFDRTALAADAAVGLAEFDRFHGVTLPGLLDAVLDQVDAESALPARLLRARGNIAVARSDYGTAQDSYQRALPLYEQIGDRRGQAACMQGLGDVALERSDHNSARVAYQSALPLLQEVGDLLGQADCIRRLGDIALEGSDQIADRIAAQSAYERALPMFRQVGNLLGEARCIRRLGSVALERSDVEGARTAFERALPMYRQVGDVLGQGNCILGLGDIAVAENDQTGARAAYRQALSLFKRVGSLHAIGWAHTRLARFEPTDQDRAREVAAARQAWMAIDRTDLLTRLDAEFGAGQRAGRRVGRASADEALPDLPPQGFDEQAAKQDVLLDGTEKPQPKTGL